LQVFFTPTSKTVMGGICYCRSMRRHEACAYDAQYTVVAPFMGAKINIRPVEELKLVRARGDRVVQTMLCNPIEFND